MNLIEEKYKKEVLMSAFTILFLCLLGTLLITIGYVYTAKEFKYMSSHPDEFSKLTKKNKIKISEKELN